MGRKAKAVEDAQSETISFRVTKELSDRYDGFVTDTGLTRSDVLRQVVMTIPNEFIQEAVSQARREKILAIRTATLKELKQKRAVAEKMIAWIDDQLVERANSQGNTGMPIVLEETTEDSETGMICAGYMRIASFATKADFDASTFVPTVPPPYRATATETFDIWANDPQFQR